MNRGRFHKSLALFLATAAAASRASGTALPAKPADALVDTIGVNVHTWDGGSPYADDWPGVVARIGEMGIRQVRDHGVGINQMNLLTDTYGVKICSIIQYPTGSQRALTDLSVLDLMLNNAKALHGIAWLEGPNEYGDVSNPQTITDLRTWTEQLKIRAQNDPQLASIPIIAPSQFYGYEQLGNISPYVDYANMHSYTAGNMPSSTVDSWTTFVGQIAPGKPVISTEIGWHDELSGNDQLQTDEQTVGKYVPRTFFEYFNRGVAKTFIYELVDDRPDPAETYGEGHYGMLNNDLSYKPSGLHTKNLISLLADPGPAFTPSSLDYTLTGGDADVHTTLLQKRDGKFYLAIWQEKRGYDNATRTEIPIDDQAVTLTLNSPMILRRFLLDDVSAALQVSASSTFQLNVPDQVMIVELSTPQPGWNVNAGGNWTDAGNWAGANAPNAAGATANFLSAIDADRTITLDANQSVGTINFWNTRRYTIAGTNALTMQAGAAGVQAAINVLAGSHTIAAPIVLASDTTIDVDLAGSTLTLTGDMSGTGALNKTGAGTLAVKHVRAGDLKVTQGTLQVTHDSTAAGVSHVKTLSISPGATLDLTDNKLITTSPTTDVATLLTTGRLTSSSTVGMYKMLGIASASDAGISATALWGGQTAASTDTLVMYTYGGDATLDGKLDIDDYVKIDSGIASNLTGWSNGDFNYDGKINVDDYFLIDTNLPNQGAPFDSSVAATSRVAVVPEPTFPILGLSLSLVGRRRRRATTAA